MLKNNVKEPVVTEITPESDSDPELTASDRHESRHVSASITKPALTPSHFSPTPLAPSIRLNKRPSILSRTIGSVRASIGKFTSTFVREQHSIVRDRCQRELGASVGRHAFDTSYDDLKEWIKAERLTRLPHKGGSWDRVLISAQCFAEQVHHFSQHIEAFTEESGAATNFVFGQCLILLEVCTTWLLPMPIYSRSSSWDTKMHTLWRKHSIYSTNLALNFLHS